MSEILKIVKDPKKKQWWVFVDEKEDKKVFVVQKSKVKNKKYSIYDVKFDKNKKKYNLDKKFDIGDKRYEHYEDQIGEFSQLDHNDKSRLKNFWARHGKSDNTDSKDFWNRLTW